MQFEKWVPVDLVRLPNHVMDIGMPVFRGDADSVRLGAVLTRDGEPETVTGTVQGLALLPNGMGIPPFEGSKDGNRVWIDVPELAMALSGRITLAIRVVDGSEKTVLLSATALVRRMDADETLDPDDVIPTWPDVMAKIAEMDEATADCVSATENAMTVTVDGTNVIFENAASTTETVTGATPEITAAANHRYLCGTLTSLSITPPNTGICEVRFTSGTTATTLTVPNTVLWPAWFDPTSLSASTVYDIMISDGIYGAVMKWA